MGTFGEPHDDKLDDAGSNTAMVVNSQLPTDYEVGRFHLLSLGLFFFIRRSKRTDFLRFGKARWHATNSPA